MFDAPRVGGNTIPVVIHPNRAWFNRLYFQPSYGESLLKKEDGHLYSHLGKIKALPAVPWKWWAECCFAGVLPDTSFER